MENLKHTSEKWTFENIFGRLIVTAGKKGFVIAEVTNKGVIHLMDNEPEAIANAKLITVAPELLKVCTDLLNAFVHKENDKKGNQTRTDIFKYCPEFGEIAVAARSAINKATE